MQGRYRAISGPSTGRAIPIPAHMDFTGAVLPIPVLILVTPVAQDAVMKSTPITREATQQRLSLAVVVRFKANFDNTRPSLSLNN